MKKLLVVGGIAMLGYLLIRKDVKILSEGLEILPVGLPKKLQIKNGQLELLQNISFYNPSNITINIVHVDYKITFAGEVVGTGKISEPFSLIPNQKVNSVLSYTGSLSSNLLVIASQFANLQTKTKIHFVTHLQGGTVVENTIDL